jgi:molecular chaperone GrpE
MKKRSFTWEGNVADQQQEKKDQETEQSNASAAVGSAEGQIAEGQSGGAEELGQAGEKSELEIELESARREAKEHYDKLLRLAAEFENFKKRMEREKQNALKFAEENIIRELLPSLDNLERALEQGRQSQDLQGLLEGIEMTRAGLLNCLEKFGLQQLQSEGEAFDPNFHEALTMEANCDIPANHVVQEFQKGYLYKDRLLRAAKVIVSGGEPK